METQAFEVGLEVRVGVPKMEIREKEIQMRRLSRLYLRGSGKPVGVPSGAWTHGFTRRQHVKARVKVNLEHTGFPSDHQILRRPVFILMDMLFLL